MEIGSTLINAFVVLAMGTFLTYTIRDRVSRLELRLGRLENRVDAGFDAVRSEFRSEIQGLRSEFRSEIQGLRSEFRSEFNSVRADLTAVALAVRGEPARPSRESGQP